MGDWRSEQQEMMMDRVRRGMGTEYTFLGGIPRFFGGIDPIDPIKPEPKPDKKLLLL